MTSKKEFSLPPLDPPKGIPEALPDWTLDAECWLFPFYTTGSMIEKNKQNLNIESDTISLKLTKEQGLEKASYNPLEDVSSFPSSDIFKGGLGGWILYRYKSSPVGPYDELIYVAGTFDSKGISKTKGLRITNIYVSTNESIWNGRRNWNIPKHLAKFQWSHEFRSKSNKDEQTVTIWNFETSSEKPLFKANLSKSKFIPYIPINTNYLFGIPLYQPPLLYGLYEKGSHEAKVETESLPNNIYRSTTPSFQGKFTIAYCQYSAGRNSFGDGKWFPEAKNTLGIGCYFPNVIVGFPWSEAYPAKKL